ncbi:unnamed protein product [Hymenolepis diminuta]|uniref:F-actin binding domain-containing protein n=1 Tax=Hymenolepis diminuta TaxID=6216 RepID=A0A0R3SE82_HYMDI|nr:unnamed protein product [Hymenolepis diminuta]
MRNARIGVKQKLKPSEKSFSSSLKSKKMAEYNHRNHRNFANVQSSQNEYQFNCSANENQTTGKNNKTESFENLIRLLEDLKTTIMESTKSGKSNLRESTIVSMETVLNQIKSRLNESQMKVGLEGSEESSSSVVSMIREVENSIKSLKRPIDSSKPPISTLKPPSLKVNSLEIPSSGIEANQTNRSPTDTTSPLLKDTRASPSQLSSQKASKGFNNLSETNAEITEVEIKNSGSRQSKRSIESHKSATPAFKYSIAKKNLVKSGTLQQPSPIKTEVEEPERNLIPSKAGLESRNSEQASTSSPDVIQRKSQSCPPPENRKIIAESKSPFNTDTGRKFSTVLSRVSHSLRSHSGRSPLSKINLLNRESIKLCSRILKFCAEIHACSPGEVTQFQNVSPEELYEKISAMGPEGEEFLKSAQIYLDHSSLNVTGRGTVISSGNDIREEPDGRPSISKKSENRTFQEDSIRTMSADQNNFENDSTKLMLQDLGASEKSSDLKSETTKIKLDPEVISSPRELRNSLPSSQVLQESEICHRKTCVSNQDPGENVDLENFEGTSASRDSRKSNFIPLPQSQMTDIKSALNDICRCIIGIDSRDQSGPGSGVLNMLTDVRDTIKSISASQQEPQPAQPEVLSALKEIRETIYGVEERTQQAQERTNKEMMSMLDSVRKSIRSVEVSNDETAALKNQQIVDALNEMRQSVTNLEERSLAPEKTLNPKVASLLSEIRSSIRFMESVRASQRSATDASMMNVLQDIKQSLVSIEGKRNSAVSQRPSVNMFVLGRKSDHPEEVMNSRNGFKARDSSSPKSSVMLESERIQDLRHEKESYQEETNQIPPHRNIETPPTLEDNYVKKALDDIRQSMQQIVAQKPPSCDGTELKESINEVKQEIRSLYSERSSIRKLSESVTDIKTGMKSLIDNIPVIVDAASQTPGKSDRKASSVKKNSIPNEESSSGSEEKASSICKKVLDIMSEMKEESALNLPKPLKMAEGSNLRMPVNSVDQLPSTFTFSFVGPQPPDINEPMVININGRNFKCSRI